MINIKDLTQSDIGRWVIYNPKDKYFIPVVLPREKGCIKSWNDKFIFVVYKCDFQWDKFLDYTGCATSPEDLEFVNKGEIV